MRTIVIISLSFLFSETGFTQAKIIDSLSKAYQTADNKGKILLLSEIGYYYRIINPDSALLITHTALEMAKRAQFLQGEASALASIGAVHRIQGDMQKAMLYFFKSLRIAQKYNFETEVAKTHLGIGVVYSDLKEFNLAIQNINIAARIYEKLDNKERYSTTLANLGEVYMRKKQLDSALIFLKKPLDYAQDIRSSAILPFSYSRLARVYLRLRNYDLAYTHAMKAIELGRQGNNTRVKCYTYQVLAEYHQSLNKIDSAIYYAENAFKLAKTYNYQWDILESINTLANLYESKDLKLALHYSKFSIALSDSLSGVDRVNALQRKIIEEQEIVRKKEASNLAAQNQLRQNVLLGGLAILGLIGFILYRNNRQKQKANLILENTLLKLQATQAQLIQSEKLASLGELTAGIAHEIQNPLNFVNNFAEVSAEMLDEMHEELEKGDTTEAIAIATDLKTNLEKINHHGQRASAIVKGMLEHSRASTGVKEPTDLNALADEYLRLAYHGLRAKDSSFNATMETHFDPDLPKVSVIPQDIGRVLLNLINNAFYAVQQRTATVGAPLAGAQLYVPTVTVSTKRLENAIEIHIQDNGPGIPESIRDKIFQPFFTTKPTGQGTGLGLSLAYDIVTKGHGGVLDVQSQNGAGSTFIISLPFNGI